MSQLISSVDVDLLTGEAYVVYQNEMEVIYVARIDVENTAIQDQIPLDVGMPATVIVEQAYGDLLPFSFESIASPSSAMDLTFSLEGVSETADFGYSGFNQLTQTTHQTATDVAVADNGDSEQNSRQILIWSKDSSGVGNVKYGNLPGLDFERFNPPMLVSRLPKFTWNLTSKTRQTGLLVGKSNGRVEIYLLSEAGGSWEPNSALATANSPLGAIPVTGLATNSRSRHVLASDGDVVMSADSRTFWVNGYREFEDGITILAQYPANVGWGVTETGRLLRLELTDNEHKIFLSTDYGIYDRPQRIVWSGYHQSLLVMGQHTVSKIDIATQRAQTIQASTTHRFIDMDVDDTGHLLLLYEPVDRLGSYYSRVFDSDLFRVLMQVQSSYQDEQVLEMKRGGFVAQGKAVVGAELKEAGAEVETNFESSSSQPSQSSSSDSSLIEAGSRNLVMYVMDINTQTVVSNEIGVNSQLADVACNIGQGKAIAVTYGGEVVDIELDGETLNLSKLGSVGSGIVTSELGVFSTESAGYTPEKIRVLVGSKPWLADRWDSGEIQTSLSSILYGGGDNLLPGQTYWVQVVVCVNGAWSSPQLQQFIVPKE